ncbi:hypothetical protein PanWU01x14_369070, partial [Parasponia andersonii]
EISISEKFCIVLFIFQRENFREREPIAKFRSSGAGGGCGSIALGHCLIPIRKRIFSGLHNGGVYQQPSNILQVLFVKQWCYIDLSGPCLSGEKISLIYKTNEEHSIIFSTALEHVTGTQSLKIYCSMDSFST